MTVPNQHYIDEIASLRQRIDYLEAENAQLKGENNFERMRLMHVLKLSPMQSQLLFVLSDGRPHSRHHLLDVCAQEGSLVNTISVQKAHIKRKVPWLEIVTMWGIGLVLEGESLARVRAIMKGEMDA